VPLTYTVGQELLYINGVLLVRGSDYTATTGTTITGLAPLALNDIADLWSPNTFNVTNAILSTTATAKGDLLAATAASTIARLGVGTNGQLLTADSTAATGIKWATPAGGGKVLQVVTATYGTQVYTTSETYSDTGLTASITPSSSSSRVLVLVSQSGVGKDGSGNAVKIRLVRDGSEITVIDTVIGYSGSVNTQYIGTISSTYLDSPASTSSLTYKTQFGRTTSSGYSFVQTNSNSTSTITLLEIGA
jgi:hypothetical protein